MYNQSHILWHLLARDRSKYSEDLLPASVLQRLPPPGDLQAKASGPEHTGSQPCGSVPVCSDSGQAEKECEGHKLSCPLLGDISPILGTSGDQQSSPTAPLTTFFLNHHSTLAARNVFRE